MRFVHETFEEISEIALSGLLGIIVWLLISQGSINTNVYLLGAISLTVGLVTKEIVVSLKSFAMRIKSSRNYTKPWKSEWPEQVAPFTMYVSSNDTSLNKIG